MKAHLLFHGINEYQVCNNDCESLEQDSPPAVVVYILYFKHFSIKQSSKLRQETLKPSKQRRIV